MIEFRKAIIPDEIDALCEFDRRAFHAYPKDAYGPERWKDLESYWAIADGKTVGCTAFGQNIDYDDRPRPGCLYISSTSVLPEFQGQGFGKKQKEWQIEYAKQNGFQVIVTNMRQSNERIIGLNERFGFQRRKVVPNCFSAPAEAAVVMELDLGLQKLPTPCPQCGKPLRTPRAMQCRFCRADWH
jgi:ribosomal protein S18 acetylase RimI-like enzyme